MAGRFLIFVILGLRLGAVLSSTLYQWIVDSRTRFNYDPDRNNMLGVYNWPRSFPENCAGQHQSPVDIDTNRVRYGIQCPCPRMIYRSPILAGELKNNGHSASFEPDSPMAFYIMDAPQRPGTYYLNDFHVHFGGVTGRSFELQGMRFRGSGMMSAGAEHTIDGLRFEGELHFVFYNSKYGNLQEAESKHDGMVVITLLVQKLPGTMVDNGETSEFSRFLEENVPLVQGYQQNASIEVDLRIFFNRRCEFYTYSGSITTPTCHESVRWVIMKDPIMVTERAWFLLTGLQSRGDFNSRFGNYRTTQPLNDRVIEANFLRTPEQGPVRPMPDGEAIMGPGMFMGMARQPDIPMPATGNRAPMLNNNPNLMPAMQMGGNRSPMLNGNPNLMLPIQSGGNRSPMLNGNPNLMPSMPGGAPMPDGAPMPGRALMSSGAPMPGRALMPGGAPMPGRALMPDAAPMPGRAPVPGGAPMPGRASMPGGAPMPGRAPMLGRASMPGGAPMSGGTQMPSGAPMPGRVPMSGGAQMIGSAPRPGGAQMPDGLPISGVGNRSPMLNGNPNLTPAMPGGMVADGQMFMPVVNQNFLSNNNNNNNNNNDDENNNNSNRNRNANSMFNANIRMRQLIDTIANTRRMMNAVQRSVPMPGQQASTDPLMGGNMGPPPSMKATQPNVMTKNTVLQKADMQPTSSRMLQMGTGATAKQDMTGQVGGVASMVSGSQKKGGNQAMVMMLPVNMLQWWKMNQEHMRRLDSNFFKVW